MYQNLRFNKNLSAFDRTKTWTFFFFYIKSFTSKSVNAAEVSLSLNLQVCSFLNWAKTWFCMKKTQICNFRTKSIDFATKVNWSVRFPTKCACCENKWTLTRILNWRYKIVILHELKSCDFEKVLGSLNFTSL